MPKQKSWIIMTDGSQPIHDIAKKLADAGLTGAQVLEEIGAITGKAADDAVDKLRKVRGVSDVSPDSPIDVGPPGSPETW